jgi:hypothetical protein
MKSLAEIAGLNKQSNVRIGYNFSFDLTPDAKQIQGEIFSGKESSGLIKAEPYIMPDPVPDPKKAKPKVPVKPAAPIIINNEEDKPEPVLENEPNAPATPLAEEGNTAQEDAKYEAQLKAEEAIKNEQLRQELNKLDEEKNLKKQEKISEENKAYENLSGVKGSYVQQLEKNLKGDSDYSISQYHQKYLENAITNAATKEDVSAVQKGIMDYVSSPLYEKRQGNYPEQYTSYGNQALYTNGKSPNLADFQGNIAKQKRDIRLKQLSNVPADISTGANTVYKPFENSISLASNTDSPTIAHEIGHSIGFDPYLRDKEGKVLESKGKVYAKGGADKPSDMFNTKYYDKSVSGNVNPSFGLNKAEIDKFVGLARDTNNLGVEHYDKKMSAVFANEQYGDLTAFREMLQKNGVTKSFGEDIDKDKIKKAMENKNITTNPLFKRFISRYGTDGIIELNNTIAMNNKGGNNDTLNA